MHGVAAARVAGMRAFAYSGGLTAADAAFHDQELSRGRPIQSRRHGRDRRLVRDYVDEVGIRVSPTEMVIWLIPSETLKGGLARRSPP